jgi:N-acetylmuramoyl-L-alanine amidase
VIANRDSVLSGLRIVLDAGHGGDNSGARGATGANEKDANLNIVQHLERILVQRGVRVVLTRADDSNPSMSDRISSTSSESGKGHQSGIFLSSCIHR